MQERRYLLNIGQMLEGSESTPLFRDAFDRVDGKRRQTALAIKNARAQAACIGAGLLIQKALADHMAECLTELPAALGTGCLTESLADLQTEYQTEARTGLETGYRTEARTEQQEQSGDFGVAEKPILERFSVEDLLTILEPRVAEPCYRYGKNGKPYLTDYSFQFNLSHSGDFVFCGVSEQEIGVDIQKIQGDRELRLAKRFFADPECQALEACENEELRLRMFFRMWVRKEAYGKLTGEGIAGAVGKCLWKDVPAGEELSACSPGKGLWWENDLIWEEYDVPDDYRIAVCRYRQIM